MSNNDKYTRSFKSQSNGSSKNQSKLPSIDSFKFGFEYEALVGYTDKTITILQDNIYNHIINLPSLSLSSSPHNSRPQDVVERIDTCDKHFKSLRSVFEGKYLRNNPKSTKAQIESTFGHHVRQFAKHYVYTMLLNSYIPNNNKFIFAPGYHDDRKCVPSLTEMINPCFSDEKYGSKCWETTLDTSVSLGDSIFVYTKLNNGQYSHQIMVDDLLKDMTIIENIENVSPILSWKDITEKKKGDGDGNGSELEKEKRTKFETVLDVEMSAGGLFNYFHNDKTSNHVHLSLEKEFQNPFHLADMCIAWWYFEPLFIALVGFVRTYSGYCDPLRDVLIRNIIQHHKSGIDGKTMNISSMNEVYNEVVDIYDNFTSTALKLPNSVLDKEYEKELHLEVIDLFQKNNRYVALNLINLKTFGTMEIRLKNGSTDSKENAEWMKLLAFFLYAVLKNGPVSEFKGGKNSDFDKDKFIALSKKMNKLDRPSIESFTKSYLEMISDPPKEKKERKIKKGMKNAYGDEGQNSKQNSNKSKSMDESEEFCTTREYLELFEYMKTFITSAIPRKHLGEWETCHKFWEERLKDVLKFFNF